MLLNHTHASPNGHDRHTCTRGLHLRFWHIGSRQWKFTLTKIQYRILVQWQNMAVCICIICKKDKIQDPRKCHVKIQPHGRIHITVCTIRASFNMCMDRQLPISLSAICSPSHKTCKYTMFGSFLFVKKNTYLRQFYDTCGFIISKPISSTAFYYQVTYTTHSDASQTLHSLCGFIF